MKKTLMVMLVCGLLLLALTAVVRSSKLSANSPPEVKKTTDVQRIAGLLDEMKTVDLSKLTPLPAERFALPPAGVDVMRVRLEETYEIKGIGRDTVELVGWIAAKHDNARPAEGETDIRWGTAIVDTEFVGLELRGESKLFGPVLVHLDRNHRSIGEVGNLSLTFLEQIALDTAYREFRENSPLSSIEIPATAAPPGGQDTRGSRVDRAAITQTVQGLWRAIGRKDARGMLRFYAPGVPTTKGGEDEVARQFANIRSIRVIPAGALNIRFKGQTANVTANGVNRVIDSQGRSASSSWTTNLELENQNGRWLITRDRTVLGRNLGREGDRGCSCCLAKISVEVEMPNLDLKMATKFPVTWYSEVETIPPVGYTASVSSTATPMISGGREVATLKHGAVKFREVVRRIPLEGTNWNPVVASKR